jgi:hypothetical protein
MMDKINKEFKERNPNTTQQQGPSAMTPNRTGQVLRRTKTVKCHINLYVLYGDFLALLVKEQIQVPLRDLFQARTST